VSAHVGEVRSELARGPLIQRLATVQLLLQGAPIARDRAEAQLGYALTGHHLAAIVWVDSEDQVGGLDLATEQLMRTCGAVHRLTLVAGFAALWVWLPVTQVPPEAELFAIVENTNGVRIAIGRPGEDLHGFRRSHLDAAAAQNLLARLGSRRRVVRFEDVQLISLLTSDVAEAQLFIADTLGALASADRVLRHTVRVFIAEQFNTSKAAEKLFAHRNTIDRRLARVDELLPRPLAQNPIAVDTALALVELREDD
jgi:DNA-binding PucR family transcriptional regulator